MESAILCRPTGGFNDTLCRIQKCLKFAKETGRSLIIDTSDSGLMGDFDTFLTFRQDTTGVDVTTALSPELIKKWDTVSAYPGFLNRDITISEFLTKTPSERNALARQHGLRSLITPLKGNRPEALVYYEGGGGGQSSFRLLPHIHVSDTVRDHLIAFAAELPTNYIAAHLRSTDYQADADDFLTRLRKQKTTAPIFLATDNPRIHHLARTIYLPGRIINPAPPSPLDSTTPKHIKSSYAATEQRHDASVHMLQDLFALAGSSRLYYPFLDPRTTEHGLLKASGFSELAAHLAGQPHLFESFFRIPRPTEPIPGTSASRILAGAHLRYRHWGAKQLMRLPEPLRPTGALKRKIQR
jgi:hypothetical protein